MATYKAEFLSHYYKGRLRPRHAYTLGLIHMWARVGSAMPGLTNFITQTPALRSVTKKLAGIADGRQYRCLPADVPEVVPARARATSGMRKVPVVAGHL